MARIRWPFVFYAAVACALAVGLGAAAAAEEQGTDRVKAQTLESANKGEERGTLVTEFKKSPSEPTQGSRASNSLPRSEATGTASLLRLGLGLAVVLSLLFGLVFVLRRMGYGQTASGNTLEILASRSLGPRERVVLLRTGERHLLLGVAPGRVATLDQWVDTFQEFDQ
jgi:flagellar biosynthetic protein FliO